MIAENRHKSAPLRQVDQHVENALGIHATINGVANGDDRVVGFRIDCEKDRSKGVRAAVDISDGDGAGHDLCGEKLSRWLCCDVTVLPYNGVYERIPKTTSPLVFVNSADMVSHVARHGNSAACNVEHVPERPG